MFLLSSEQRKEFLAVSELVRLVIPDNTPVPSLLIKACTLTLKYLYRLRDFKFICDLQQDGTLLYAVQIEDDPAHAATIWSLAGDANEVQAAKRLVADGRCDVFLINEALVTACSTSVQFELCRLKLDLDNVKIHPRFTASEDHSTIGQRLDLIHTDAKSGAIKLILRSKCEWKAVKNYYITNSVQTSVIDMVDGDEGDQQEEVALWFIDVLKPDGAVRKPQIPEGASTRELTDLLLSYEMGCFLIESKTLSVLERGELPDRARLKKNTLKNIKKALGQLSGACRSLRRGLPVTTEAGALVSVERKMAPHCIVLVPDLSLLAVGDNLGATRIKEFFDTEGGYLHIMDTSALLRSVQHALVFSERSESGFPPIMTFDHALLERWKVSLTHETPDFVLLMRQSLSEE